MFDVAVKFLRENHEGLSDAGVRELDEGTELSLADFLQKRSSRFFKIGSGPSLLCQRVIALY